MGPISAHVPVPRTGQAVPNLLFLTCPGGGDILFLLERKGSWAQSLATWSPTPSSFALLHSTPIPLMQEEYQEYEPEA